MKFIEKYQMMDPLELYPDFSGISITQDIVMENQENIKMMKHKDIFFDYIDKSVIPENLSKNTLKKIVNKLLEE